MDNGSAARAWENEHPRMVPELRRLWREGVPTREIATTLRMSVSTLWLVTRRLELTPRAETRNGYRERRHG
jgi:orotate phosphoribosyltransferase-like protein